MRTSLLLLALAATSVVASAQSTPRPKGFLNFNWGASRGEVLTALRGQGVLVPEEDPGGDKLVGEGGTFAGQSAVSWSLDFAGGRFYSATVTLRGTESGRALYRELKQQLITKYGPLSSEGKLGNSPEERRARALYGTTAAKRGMAAVWKFGPTLQWKDTVSIACEVTASEGSESEDDAGSLVTIRYTNETVKAQAVAVAAAAAAAESASEKTSKPVKPDCL